MNDDDDDAVPIPEIDDAQPLEDFCCSHRLFGVLGTDPEGGVVCVATCRTRARVRAMGRG